MLSMLWLATGQISHAAEEPKTAAEVHAVDVMPTVSQFLEAIRSGNAEQAYKQFTSAEFQKATDKDQFLSFVKKYAVLEKSLTFQPRSFYVEGPIATFEGALISSANGEISAEFDLTREAEKWKILGIDLYSMEITVPRNIPASS